MSLTSTKSQPAPRLSWLAVFALLLGLLGFSTILLLGVFPAIIGLICGHVALIKMKHGHSYLRGRMAAIIGLIAGYATVMLTPLLAIAIAVAIPLINTAHEESQERRRLDHASELFRTCEAYARDNDNRYPQDWDPLRGRYLSPAEMDRLLEGQHGTFWENVQADVIDWFEGDHLVEARGDFPAFEVVPHERPVLRALEGSVIVIREIAPSGVERIVVVYDNGVTTMIANPNQDRP